MAQFYFLSVLFNILAGLILLYGRDLTAYSSGGEGSGLPSVDSLGGEEGSGSACLRILRAMAA